MTKRETEHDYMEEWKKTNAKLSTAARTKWNTTNLKAQTHKSNNINANNNQQYKI